MNRRHTGTRTQNEEGFFDYDGKVIIQILLIYIQEKYNRY